MPATEAKVPFVLVLLGSPDGYCPLLLRLVSAELKLSVLTSIAFEVYAPSRAAADRKERGVGSADPNHAFQSG
jgi:hypothetical protein